MIRLVSGTGTAALLLIVSAGAGAQATARHDHAAQEKLGTVRFDTSCNPQVAPAFNRAVALLHSFEFGASIRAFTEDLTLIAANGDTITMSGSGVVCGNGIDIIASGTYRRRVEPVGSAMRRGRCPKALCASPLVPRRRR